MARNRKPSSNNSPYYYGGGGGKPKPPARNSGGGGGGGSSKKKFNLNTWAQQQADKYIQAQVQAIQEQQRIYMEELRRQAEDRVKAGQAFAGWLQGQNFPGQIQSIYQQAGNDITGYGSGFSQNMQAVANADAAAQMNMLSGTGQEGAVRNEGQNMGDVLYGAYGWSPAMKFAETGAAFAADAANQPSFASQIANMEAAQMHNEGLGALADFAKAIAEAKGTRPDIIGQFKETWQKSRDAEFDRRMTMLKFQADQAYKEYLRLKGEGQEARANEYLAIAQRRQQQMENEAMGLDINGKPLKNKKDSRKDGPSTQPGSDAYRAARMKDVEKATGAIEDEFIEAFKNLDQKVLRGLDAHDRQSPSFADAKRLVITVMQNIRQKYSGLGVNAATRRRLDEIIRETADRVLIAYRKGLVETEASGGGGVDLDKYFK